MSIKRGAHCSPLDRALQIFRLADPNKQMMKNDQIANPQFESSFTLSSADKRGTPPHLSVWETTLTTKKQALSFLGQSSPKRLALYLKIQEIRNLSLFIKDQKLEAPLHVIWTHLEVIDPNDPQIINCPGAHGHAGITGLSKDFESLTKKEKKMARRDLRRQLADLASKDFKSF